MDFKEFVSSEVKNISTYSYSDFEVDITDKADSYEAYIYHKDYSIKSLMFGVSKDQGTLNEFMEMVFDNLPEYIEVYKSEYMD